MIQMIIFTQMISDRKTQIVTDKKICADLLEICVHLGYLA